MKLILNKFSITGLSPATLTIKQGECVGLSGESGCGKTRLLRAIADLDEHEGDMHLGDTSWDAIAPHRWRLQVALLPAESQWWFDTIGEHFTTNNVVVPALGFDEKVMSWESSRCSSGEKQRLSILRMLSNKPRVLLLDEPTANLDESNTSRVEQLIADYVTKEKAIVIWVSHNREQLQRVSDRQYTISNGKLMADSASTNNESNQVAETT